jgi:hypothetical protein
MWERKFWRDAEEKFAATPLAPPFPLTPSSPHPALEKKEV